MRSQQAEVIELFRELREALDEDFTLLTKGRESAPISGTNALINADRIFMEEGAWVEYSVLNASEGPIYIGRNAEIMEGSLIRGGLALCDHAVLKMGAKVYGPTTIGPYGKVCGEISNSVILVSSMMNGGISKEAKKLTESNTLASKVM